MVKKISIALLLLVVLLSLSSCSETGDYYFYSDRSWKLVNSLTIDRALLDLGLDIGNFIMGGELGFQLPDSLTDSRNWVELALDAAVNIIRNQGVEARWSNAGNTYKIFIEGEDINQINSLTSPFTNIEVLSDGSYHLKVNSEALLQQYQVPAAGMFPYSREVRLHAKKILSSNAYKVKGNVAIWRGVGNMDVVFIPLSPFSAAPILVVFVLVCIILFAVVVGKSLGGRPCPNCGKKNGKAVAICPGCGSFTSFNQFG